MADNTVVPVFPLPSFAMFPGIVTPLHIFEPRYRRLVEDLLDRRGIFAIGTLEAEGEPLATGRTPPIHRMGCVCELLDYERQKDGRFNVIVRAVSKVEMAEVPARTPYRQVSVRVRDTKPVPRVDRTTEQQLRELAERALLRQVEAPSELVEHVRKLDYRALIYVMSFYCPGPTTNKTVLLDMSTYSEMGRFLVDVYGDQYPAESEGDPSPEADAEPGAAAADGATP